MIIGDLRQVGGLRPDQPVRADALLLQQKRRSVGNPEGGGDFRRVRSEPFAARRVVGRREKVGLLRRTQPALDRRLLRGLGAKAAGFRLGLRREAAVDDDDAARLEP